MAADAMAIPDPGYTVGPYRPELDAGIIRALNAAFPAGWGSEADWRWKQPDRPGFVPEDVWVAAAGNDVVGCYSTTILPVSLGHGLVVPLSFDGDLAVPPAYRGRGIPAAIRDASERWALEARVPLRGGFTTAGLNARVYNPLYGLTFFPAVTTEFRKALGLAPLRRHVEALGVRVLAAERVRSALARRPIVINLRVAGIDDAHIVLGPDAFRLVDGQATGAHFKVRVPPTVLASLRNGSKAFARTLARETARGRVRVRGLPGGIRLARLAAALIRWDS